MKRLLNYIPLHFVVFLIFGICFQFFTQFWSFSVLKTVILVVFLTMLIFIVQHKVFSTLISFLLFFFIGISVVYLNDDRNYDSFYEYHLKENSTVILQIHAVLKSGNYHQKYEAKVLRVDAKKTTGTVLLNIKKSVL